MDKLSLKLEVFEGPLDLLLHLIQKNKVNIYDIPVADITEQYLDYLREMKELDLEVASEFIVMASQLLYIKSRMLLPKPEMEEDPRQELVQKLLEYKIYKEITSYFAEREQAGSRVFVKEPEPLDPANIKRMNITSSLEELSGAVMDIVKRIKAMEPPPKAQFNGVFERRVYSVGEMKQRIIEAVKGKDKFPFISLFHRDMPKGEIIAIFLAALELLKANIIDAVKKGRKGDLFIIKKQGENVWK